MSRLPCCRADQLEDRPPDQGWLVERLWADEAVGIVGGEPKCGKSFLALDVAVAVASGAACLQRFRPLRTGPVLLFAGEDPLHVVRRRLQGIAAAAGVPFAGLNVHVITAPRLRLDLAADQERLTDTVDALRPRLLVLDPFVRLHRIDENVAAEVAPLLASLRQLQRTFHTAVLLVHHARKGPAGARAGQALRGSSELHAWGDSNLYLRREGSRLRLTVEHRAAASGEELDLELQAKGPALALQPVDPTPEPPSPPAPSAGTRIEQALAASSKTLTRRDLRRACRMRSHTLGQTLAALVAQGRVLREQGGYRLP